MGGFIFYMAKLTTEDKKEIVRLRLEEGVSLSDLSIRFGINKHNVEKLISKYKIHGEKIFEKSHKTLTPEIKLEVINRIMNGESKNSLAIEYLIAETQVNDWLKRYKENGYNGLNNKPKGRPSTMRKKKEKVVYDNPKDKELAELKQRNIELEAEVEALKKLRALVLQRNAQQQKKKQ